MTKIDIISGFLGAGKTTLIKNCFRSVCGDRLFLSKMSLERSGLTVGF